MHVEITGLRRRLPAISVPHRRLLAVPLLVTLADMFFLRPGQDDLSFHDSGITVPLYILALAVAVAAVTPQAGGRRLYVVAGLFIGLALLPALETLNTLTFCIALAGLVCLTLHMHRRFSGDIFADMRIAGRFITRGPIRLVVDATSWLTLYINAHRKRVRGRRFTIWLMPVVLTLCFLLLLAQANPVLEDLITGFQFDGTLNPGDAQRLAFWLVVAAACWPFLRLRIRRKIRSKAPVDSPARTATGWQGDYFGPAAIVRALCLFNMLFAVQTFMDVAYLWGRAALPNGISLAAYAHRGAYTLIVTALLAALFVLLATRSGLAGEQSRRIRPLILLWTFQNVLLVASSVYRLDLYVESYSLTYWRIAALIWMVLVFTGLVLIFLKIALGRTNGWLMSRNLMAAGILLYGTGLVNFPNLIADYNIRAGQAGTTVRLDTYYLSTLGYDVLPAIDAYRARRNGNGDQPRHPLFRPDDEQLEFLRYCLIQDFRNRPRDWRQWSFRRMRMAYYLASTVTEAPALPEQFNNRNCRIYG